MNGHPPPSKIESKSGNQLGRVTERANLVEISDRPTLHHAASRDLYAFSGLPSIAHVRAATARADREAVR